MLGAALPKVRYLLADKAYDADHWRGYLKSRRIQPVIPNCLTSAPMEQISVIA